MLPKTITLQKIDDAPPAGYGMRPANLDDVPAVTAMFNVWARHVLGVDDMTEESLRISWTEPHVNLAEDARIVLAPDGQIAGYGSVWGLFEPYTQIYTWVRVHPAHQQRGLEAALLGWAETRARQAALPRASGGTRVSLIGFRPAEDAPGIAAYERAGYEGVRYNFRMRVDLNEAPPSPVWPAGVTVRSFVPGQDEAAVIQVQQTAFRDHWGYVAPTVEEDLNMLRHWMSHPRFDPALWLLVMAGDRLAGISLNNAHLDEDPEMGWITTLGVLREFRQRGIARALLLHAFGQFYRRGQKRAGLAVDTQNLTGALRLYESVGLRAYRTMQIFEKELRPGLELSTRQLA